MGLKEMKTTKKLEVHKNISIVEKDEESQANDEKKELDQQGCIKRSERTTGGFSKTFT